ncbi:hypothetical protein N7456_002654 [Penicillium angulare]|uniref:CoA-transferase family III n=1 Tax=Penicillium angulare TaxID=116970 RepID=A0A9W9KQ37_9EURO|nr:hypothetical protein N7456_002654 [Penicillium angulare]
MPTTIHPSTPEYSTIEETYGIFKMICDKSMELSIPSDAVAKMNQVHFTSVSDHIYYPIPMKVTETLAALKGVEGLLAAVLADLRSGSSQERKIQVNLEKATVFGFQALNARIDGMSRNCPGVKKILKDTDIHAAQSCTYRRLAANLYKTKNDNEFFHLHGSLNPTTVLRMIGLDGHQCDFVDYEDIIQLVEQHVQKYTAQELETMSITQGQAGVSAYRHKEFIKSSHGSIAMRQPYWTVSPLDGSLLTPTPFSQSDNSRVLDGIKVIELSCVIAGPIIGRILAGYGAEVLRITNKGTPDVPFFQVDGNMGKRVADIDLKTEHGTAVFNDLLTDADVFINGYRSGVLERLGYGYDVLVSLAEKRERASSMSTKTVSAMKVNGQSDRGGNKSQIVTGLAWKQGKFMGRKTPIVSPLPVADYGAGCMGAITALIGLYNRAKFGGSYHGKASLVQFNLLLLSLGEYSDSTQTALRGTLPSDFFDIRYCDNVDKSSKAAMAIIQTKLPRDMPMLQKWYADGYKAEVEVMGPVVDIDGVSQGFLRATRPNGTDEPCWADDTMAVNFDYRIFE